MDNLYDLRRHNLTGVKMTLLMFLYRKGLYGSDWSRLCSFSVPSATPETVLWTPNNIRNVSYILPWFFLFLLTNQNILIYFDCSFCAYRFYKNKKGALVVRKSALEALKKSIHGSGTPSNIIASTTKCKQISFLSFTAKFQHLPKKIGGIVLACR